MGPIWGREDPGGPHVGPKNLAIWEPVIYRNIVNAHQFPLITCYNTTLFGHISGSRSHELSPVHKTAYCSLYIWCLKLWVAHAPGMPGTFYPPSRVSDPDMHHGTCVTHVPWCMPVSLTSGFFWSRWRGKCCRRYRLMRNQQFYISGKRPMERFQSPVTYVEQWWQMQICNSCLFTVMKWSRLVIIEKHSMLATIPLHMSL